MAKKKAESTGDEARLKRLEVRVHEHEKRLIQDNAAIRQLTPSEYMRRAALGRRADIRYDVEVVLSIREAVAAIRLLHKEYLNKGKEPPEDVLRLTLVACEDALKRVQT